MKSISAKAFDQKFDEGEDITDYLDFSSATPVQDMSKLTQEINIRFPQWMLEALDKEAQKIGVTRESIIKVWLSERLKQENPCTF